MAKVTRVSSGKAHDKAASQRWQECRKKVTKCKQWQEWQQGCSPQVATVTKRSGKSDKRQSRSDKAARSGGQEWQEK
jgi:hypothetical protein